MAKSDLAKWTEFSKKEREVIYKRDNYKCIVPGCNDTFGLGVAHIFVPRKPGLGVGNRLNGALLCQKHHAILDSYGSHHLYETLKTVCEEYLIKEYGDIDISTLKYNKWKNFKIGG